MKYFIKSFLGIPKNRLTSSMKYESNCNRKISMKAIKARSIGWRTNKKKGQERKSTVKMTKKL